MSLLTGLCWMEVVRASRFRHTYGTVRSKSGYEALKPRSTRDGSLLRVNESISVFQLATSGFGALVVLPTRDSDKSGATGRISDPPKIEAHKSNIQDFDISPFHNRIIATSDGGAIRLWQVPEEGLKETLRTPTSEISNPEAVKRISSLQFHPTSENLMISCGKDFIMRLFDIQSTKSVLTIKEGHSDLIQSISWDWNGSICATACKDRVLRVVDPRAASGKQIVQSVEAHAGVKGFQATWLGKRDQIVSCGFNKNGERQISIWDLRQFNAPLVNPPTNIDTSPGMILPYYDPSTEVIFLLGRGDHTIRFYEVNDDEPYIHYLDQFRGNDSQSDICPFPRRLVDYASCEIVRFAKLTKDKIEHVMFQVPRKDSKDSKIFHEDLYKFVPSSKPTSSAEQWIELKVSAPAVFLTPKEMMPEGYKSSYELDPTKKAEEERRDAEKSTLQALSISERKVEREKIKREQSTKGSFTKNVEGESSDKEDSDDDSDRESKISQIAHRRQISRQSSIAPQETSSSDNSSSSNVNTPTTSSSSTTSKLNLSSAKTSSSSSVSPDPAPASPSSSPSQPQPKHGKMKVELDGGVYDGSWKSDQKQGEGTFTHKSDSSIYKGSWMDDKRAGKGTLTAGSGSNKSSVEGTWINNALDQSTTLWKFSDGSTLEFATFNESGQLLNGKLTYGDGDVYEGAFSATTGKRSGKGVCRGKDGSKYEGEYKDDKRNGNGTYYYPDGGVYIGTWKADQPEGEGVFEDPIGKKVAGTWQKGKLISIKS